VAVTACTFDSPLGRLRLEATAAGLVRCEFGADHAPRRPPRTGVLEDAVEHLQRYFAGEPTPFSAVPLDLSAGTPFQRAVWAALARAVGYGERCTYGRLAELAGRPGAARAVGGALHRNPVPIFVPCHRVVQSGGAPGGFALGLETKLRLLELESPNAAGPRPRR